MRATGGGERWWHRSSRALYGGARKDRNRCSMLMNTHEARLDALRKELKRARARRLRRADLRRAHERICRRLCPAARLADRVRRVGRHRGGAARTQAAMFVDGRYTLQVRDQVDGELYDYESVPQTSVAEWLGEHAPRRRADRLRPVAARQGLGRRRRPRRWQASGARAGRRSTATRSTRCGPIARALRRPGAGPRRRATPAARAHDKRAEVAEWLSAQEARRRGDLARSIRSPGCSTSAARTSSARRWRCPIVIAHADGTAELFIAPRQGHRPKLRAHLGNAVRDRARARRSCTALAALAGKRVAVDPERAVRRSSPRWKRPAPRSSSCAIPTVLPKAVKNPVEQAGHRAAQARDGAAVSAVPALAVGRRRPSGGVDELAAADRLQRVPRARPATAARPVVRHDPRRRAATARSSTTGSSEETNRAARAEQRLPGRFGRAVSRRHHRHHPHRLDRPGRAARRGQGPLHPRAQGPHRARPRGLPAGHRRQPARRAGAPVPVGGRARLRPRHRPRRRQLPVGPRRAAADRQGGRRAGRDRAGAAAPA